MKYLIALATVSCATLPHHVLPHAHPCPPGTDFRAVSTRLAAQGWPITRDTATTVQTDYRVITTRDAQLRDFMDRHGIARRAYRLTVINAASGVHFRIDVRTTIAAQGAPPIVFDTVIGEQQHFSAVHWGACGVFDETPPIPPKPGMRRAPTPDNHDHTINI